jgi:hypothetical protein
MKKIILIFVVLLNCVNTQRGKCEKEQEFNEQTLYDCAITNLIFRDAGTIRDKNTNSVLYEGVFDAYIFDKCNKAFQKEKECRKKSEYIPTID